MKKQERLRLFILFLACFIIILSSQATAQKLNQEKENLELLSTEDN